MSAPAAPETDQGKILSERFVGLWNGEADFAAPPETIADAFTVHSAGLVRHLGFPDSNRITTRDGLLDRGRAVRGLLHDERLPGRPRPHPGRRPCGRRPHRHRNVRRRSPRRDRRTRPSVERIETDTEPESAGAEQWRADHPTDYERALPWLRREAQVVDTTGVLPAGVATTVLRGARSG
ncbi:hypothetical protein [Streptomyces rhizosphaericola]|uniref:hypothetical protein n=1 Tax=Streptomyces rhizosphaericola TaxID=2564098 RepID=UPI003BF5F749